MQYVEAFKKLGYRVEAPRQDWSAEKADGICITIWQKERSIANGMPYLDLWELHPDGGDWQKLSGHSKRTRHLQRAEEEFGGRIDVIFVSGTPGESYSDASSWIVEDRKNHHWHLTKFSPSSGYFRAEIRKRSASRDASAVQS